MVSLRIRCNAVWEILTCDKRFNENSTQPIAVPREVLADVLLYIISVEVCNDVLDSTDPHSKPVGVVAESAKNFIKVQWEKPKRDGGAPVTGYNIERKDLRTGTWNKLNDEPITVGVAVLCIISRLFARQNNECF